MKDSLQRSAGLNERQLADIRQLEVVCNEFERLTMKLNWDLLRERPANQVNDFLYYLDNRLVGYLALYNFSRRESEVSAMTHPDFRQQGIFTQLLAAARTELQQRGVGDFLFICEQASASGAASMAAIGATYTFSEYRMDLVRPVQPLALPANLEMRPARPEDVDDLARMDTSCFTLSFEERRERLAHEVLNNRRRLLVATLGPTKIGKIHVTLEEPGAAYIYAFCVLPEHRGKGYGKAILAYTAGQLLDEQRQNVSLEVATENKQALSLYERCGFEVTAAYDYYRLAVGG